MRALLPNKSRRRQRFIESDSDSLGLSEGQRRAVAHAKRATGRLFAHDGVVEQQAVVAYRNRLPHPVELRLASFRRDVHRDGLAFSELVLVLLVRALRGHASARRACCEKTYAAPHFAVGSKY
jgi:hypothetical protein